VEKLSQLKIETRYQEMLSRKMVKVLKDTEHRSVDRKWIEIKKATGKTAKVIGEKRRVRNGSMMRAG
jgi:hypothetical protein